jgi:predicted DNA-binding transcriptional regulator AlpA
MSGRMVDASEIVGVLEIAQMLGLGRPRVYQIIEESDFPPPIATVGKVGRLWLRSEVAAWHEARPKRPLPQHGSVSMYTNAGCRCVECRAAQAAYMRGYNRRKREAS